MARKQPDPKIAARLAEGFATYVTNYANRRPHDAAAQDAANYVGDRAREIRKAAEED
ncbi:hypothetical protein [Saccharothrix xinjiangensis]|uniref:ChaB protein n=1 Tax=Saccharothrix xinjiangensis TaxID=204798 RepID=A0ABV9XUN3_9PSEU